MLPGKRALTEQKQYSDEKYRTEQLTCAGLDDWGRGVTIHEGHYFMRTIHRSSTRVAIALALSMSALPNPVNAQEKSLTPENNPSIKQDFKDSVKDNKTGVAKLIDSVLKTGTDGNINSGLAPIIGLPRAMTAKKHEVTISRTAENALEERVCYVMYENVEGSSPGTTEKRPVCAYVVKFKRSGLDRETRWHRLDLKGKLEKVVLSQGKYDETGRVVKGSGVKTDLDIDSPEVRKTFEAEMKFWLKDWLKKQQKLDAKKATAAAAKSGSVAKKDAATADSPP